MEIIYPAVVWVLQPSFKPKQVTLIEEYSERWYKSESGKSYHDSEIHLTQADAITAGEKQLEKQQADLDKKQANIHKRKENLAKAKGALK